MDEKKINELKAKAELLRKITSFAKPEKQELDLEKFLSGFVDQTIFTYVIMGMDNMLSAVLSGSESILASLKANGFLKDEVKNSDYSITKFLKEKGLDTEAITLSGNPDDKD